MSATPSSSPVPPASTPTPDAAPKPTPDSAGRDSKGRFTPGNPGGPGNPCARRMAAYRKAMALAVSLDDMRVMAEALRDKAKQGDVAAAKLLLAYLLGKPPAAPDPDRLDIEEFRLFEEQALDPNRTLPLYAGLSASVACELARLSLPDVNTTTRRWLGDAARTGRLPNFGPGVPVAVAGDRQATGSIGKGKTSSGPKASPKEASDRQTTGSNGPPQTPWPGGGQGASPGAEGRNSGQ